MICDKCKNEILLDKWCSYECLKDKAKEEGRSIDSLLFEMMKVTEALQDAGNKGED